MLNLKKDYSVKRMKNLRRNFLQRPHKELVHWILFYLSFILYRYFNNFFRLIETFILKKNKSFSRVLNQKSIKNYAIQSKDYYEIQIKNETRPCVIFYDNDRLEFKLNSKTLNKFLSFGIAPLIHDFSSNEIENWEIHLQFCFEDGEKELKVFSLPYNGRNNLAAYYHHDGWLDIFCDISKIDKKISNIFINVILGGNNHKKGKEIISISAPQIFKGDLHLKKNIIILSCEALTDFKYLKNQYGFDVPRPVSELINDGFTYDFAYSPTESTLPFAASIASGLMVSQHGIGDYSQNADGFSCNILNQNIRTLPDILKDYEFKTIFGATGSRFSSYCGFARGYDSHYHSFKPFDPSVQPDFQWVSRQLTNNHFTNNFIFLHTDYFHGPKMVWNDKTKGKIYDYSKLVDVSRLEYINKRGLSEFSIDLAKLIYTLKQNNQYDNSLIILTGDHGSEINWIKNNNFSLYDERIRVPLIIKYPSWYSNNKKSSSIVNTNVEIHKTIYDALQIPLPEHLMKINHYLNDNEIAYSETIYNPNNDRNAHNIALMTDNFKYISWNKVDWETSKIIEMNSKDKLFDWDAKRCAYNESVNVIEENKNISNHFRKLTHQILKSNLTVHDEYQPEKY